MGGQSVRVHAQPRTSLFTPVRPAGAAPGRSLHNVRLTYGKFIDSGKHFQLADSWEGNREAYRRLSEPWVGSTLFLRKRAAPVMDLPMAETQSGVAAMGGYEDSCLLS